MTSGIKILQIHRAFFTARDDMILRLPPRFARP